MEELVLTVFVKEYTTFSVSDCHTPADIYKLTCALFELSSKVSVILRYAQFYHQLSL